MMKAIRSALGLGGLLAAMLASGATAQTAPRPTTDCRLRMDTSAGSWIIQGYDPFSGNGSTGTFDLTFVNDGEGECRFYPLFQTDAAPFGLQANGSARVPYTLLDTFGQYDATPIAGRTIRRTTNRPVVVQSHSQQLVRYIMTIQPGAIPGDGNFTQRLILNAEGVDGSPLAARQILLGIDVPPSATLGLAGAFRRNGGQADVDLGELVEGIAQVPLQLHVRSTRGYRLGLESLNGGVLRLAGTQWAVPYRVVIDGKVATIGSESAYVSSNRAGLRTDTLPLAFSIGDAANRRAGTYSDVLTVSIAVQ